MKTVKFALAAMAAFVGLASAYASTVRTVFTYVNKDNNGQYTKLTVAYNPANCVGPSTRICSYTSPFDFGVVKPTAAQILAKGGHIKTNVAKVYVP